MFALIRLPLGRGESGHPHLMGILPECNVAVEQNTEILCTHGQRWLAGNRFVFALFVKFINLSYVNIKGNNFMKKATLNNHKC